MSSDYLLLDTNIVSYIMKGNSEAERYKEHLSGKRLAISFITVGELWAGAANASWVPTKRDQLRKTICRFVVIPYDYEIAQRYGEIIAHCKRSGRPIVTHNPTDFEHIPGLHIISKNLE